MTRYYLGNYEEEINSKGNIRKIHYLPDAVYIQNNGVDSLLFVYKDYLGSWTALTDYEGKVLERYAYDPWGNRRDPDDWTSRDYRTSFLLNRGYTGHEHLDAFGVINMNGRVYDPLTAQFLSPDPYIQAPEEWLNYNRYSYCLNNPMKYTDPDGELFLLAAIYFTFFTDAGYQLQKYVSPVAVHVDLKLGTHQKGFGFDVGIGIPKVVPYAPWAEYGKTYYWKNYGGYQGWETRKGTETTYFGIYTEGQTKYEAGEFSQTVGYKKIGVPGSLGIDVYNDLWGDGGDRFRTSRVRMNYFPFYVENVLFTGDPRLYEEDRDAKRIEKCGPNKTYIQKRGDPYAPDPDKYRHGILSIGLGPISVGYDSENIRYFIQNMTVHNLTGSKYFRYVKEKKGEWYFQFGSW